MKKKFSLKARGQSFRYAFQGIIYFFQSEPNTWIHLLGTITVIILAIIFPVSDLEIISLSVAIGFVWTAELFNSAIEKMMDLVSMEKNQAIKEVKDIAAAAVLIAAITALVVGCFVFIPKF
jgi:diacylglycerol kinase (ATP)